MVKLVKVLVVAKDRWQSSCQDHLGHWLMMVKRVNVVNIVKVVNLVRVVNIVKVVKGVKAMKVA